MASECGLGSLRLQSGNESSCEQSGLGRGGGGEEGRRFSLQRTKKLRAGPVFFFGGGRGGLRPFAWRSCTITPILSSSSWIPPRPFGGERAPSFRDLIPEEKQSSHGHSVPVPTQLRLSSELGLASGAQLPGSPALPCPAPLEGSVMKTGSCPEAMARHTQSCCPRRRLSCSRKTR